MTSVPVIGSVNFFLWQRGYLSVNLPNLISLSRILLAPFFAVLYLRGNVSGAVAVLLVCAASDVLDGAIARRFGLVTQLGKALDPVADKIIQGAMMLCAAREAPSVLLLLSLHVLREFSLAVMGFYVLRVTGRVYSARWYGKLCTALLYAFVVSLLAFPGLPPAFAALGTALCAALILLCLALYTRNYVRILRAAPDPGEEQ